MSEFGNETATATLKLGEKSIDALMKLLKFIMERNDRKLNREMKAEQVRQLKANKNKEGAKEYLNKKRGYVKAKNLFNSGEKLIPIATAMSPEELSQFNNLAKISGVSFTAIADQRVIEELKTVKKELKEIEKIAKTEGLTDEHIAKRNDLQKRYEQLNNKRQDRIIIVRAKDLELVKEITDRMNMEIKFNDIDKELSDLTNKGIENLSKEEKARFDELTKEKENILKKEFDDFNDKNNDVIYQNSVNDTAWEEMSFEKAINRVTDRKYAQAPCYICERTNPNNYMEVTSMTQEHNGREFTNTEFKVFNNGVEQQCEEFSHGKFSHYSRKDGENTSSYGDGHWQNMKIEMKEKGGFSDDTLIFSSKEDYLKYKEEFEKTQENITIPKENTTSKENTMSYEADTESYKDYMGIINNLKGQLSDRNLELNEQGEICKSDTKEVVHLDKNMTNDEKMSYAEAVNIGKQIDTYKKLNDCQTQIAFIRQQQEMNEDSFKNNGQQDGIKEMYEKMRENLHKQIYDANMTFASLESKANNLEFERKQLTSIKIVDMVQEAHNEDELLSIQDRQHDSNDKGFQNEMETEKNEISSHREDHTQSKEQWNNDIQKQNNINPIANTEKVNVNVVEMEKE